MFMRAPRYAVCSMVLNLVVRQFFMTFVASIEYFIIPAFRHFKPPLKGKYMSENMV